MLREHGRTGRALEMCIWQVRSRLLRLFAAPLEAHMSGRQSSKLGALAFQYAALLEPPRAPTHTAARSVCHAASRAVGHWG